MLNNFLIPGRASFICGGQFGSEAKGAAAAWVAHEIAVNGARPWTDLNEIDPRYGGKVRRFDIVTTNAGAQAGHTSIHDGVKKVVYHLPTAPLITPGSIGYLNAGAIIDPDGLRTELEAHSKNFSQFHIHPNAAIITQECRDAEGRADSAQTKIASIRKGVGEAFSRKVLRSGVIAGYPVGASNNDWMIPFISPVDLNFALARGNKSVLVEVPQGFGLGLNQRFYPHCTSRECTPAQAASDAGIHHSLCGPVMLVLRTYPIRVGNIKDVVVGKAGTEPFKEVTLGTSGDCYPDQREISWDELGVPPEITTVSKRVRRVFTWSHQQVLEVVSATRPTHIFLSHVDYTQGAARKRSILPDNGGLMAYILSVKAASRQAGIAPPQIFYSTGPSTADVQEYEEYEL